MKSVTCKDKNVIPNKVLCVGRNYVEHIEELGNEIPTNMVLFFKPNVCISDELFTCKNEKVDFEGEISFLIQNKQLASVGFGLDLTKRKLQNELKSKGLPWERAKAFKDSAVFSEFVSFEKEENLSLELWLNDTLVQKDDVSKMIYKPKTILTEIKSFIDIEDNDIIMSGTPKGVGSFNEDDVLVGKIFENGKLLVEKEWIAR